MSYPILTASEDPHVYRHSSIDQFSGFLSVYKQGGWAPIVFDQIDGIVCDKITSHPVVLSWGDDIGYIFPEAQCTYSSDHYIYFDKEGVEQKLLPECMGGKGEFFDYYVTKSNSFVDFDNGTALGNHRKNKLRVGLSYCLADQTLPAED